MSKQPSLFDDERPGRPAKTDDSLTANQAHHEPLASRMRPRSLDEIIGQDHLVGPGRLLRNLIEKDALTSMILWGPPGSGKTTMAEVIAYHTKARFVALSAVSAGVADLRRVVDEAQKLRQFTKQRTLLFIDEIHRFNKSQQDAILPHVEKGTVTLIGATTENPSFEVNSALLSRARVFTLSPLQEEDLILILERALSNPERGLSKLELLVEEGGLASIALFANGDARIALTLLELAAQGAITSSEANRTITLALLAEVMQHRTILYDKTGEQHYDLISALHKSLRGSDPDGGLYWLGRMLEGGEEPLYIVRRLVRFASEDVGMADPQALVVCMAAQQAVHFIGMPEGALALAQAVVYLATAPKSNAIYTAYQAVQKEVRENRNDPVPLHMRNAPTRLMKDLDYGKDYVYAQDIYQNQESEDPQRPPVERPQPYLPDRLRDQEYYHPFRQGHERSIRVWLDKRRSLEKKEDEKLD